MEAEPYLGSLLRRRLVETGDGHGATQASTGQTPSHHGKAKITKRKSESSYPAALPALNNLKQNARENALVLYEKRVTQKASTENQQKL